MNTQVIPGNDSSEQSVLRTEIIFLLSRKRGEFQNNKERGMGVL